MHSWVVGCLAIVATASARSTFKVGDTVKTTSGDVIGKPSTWKPEVSEYLGIPYAKSPEGDLRWAAPVAYKAPGKAIDGTRYGASCLALISLPVANSSNVGTSMGGATDAQKEDCLFINVWTKPQTGEKKKAVMVWIYGGAFAAGSGSVKIYNGALLADEGDVVTVNMNYRLGVFGFPGMPFLPDQNLGLLDQRLAIEWVRDNIEAFGGDPSRITIYGQSAGGASVDYYAYAWTKDPIVNGFIPQSGTIRTMTLTGMNNVDTWYKGSKKLGCGGADASEKTLACLRGKSAQEVLNAMKPVKSGGVIYFGDFLPKPDGKVVFTPDEYTEKLAKGDFIKKPVLIGNTENEMATFLRGKDSRLLKDLTLKKTLKNVFNCPVSSIAKGRAAFVPTWRYSYAGDYPNQVLGPDISGPYHGSEIVLVYGTSVTTKRLEDTPEELALAKKMRNAWIAFAKDPAKGLEGIWPKYDSSKPTLIVLGGVNSSEISYKNSQDYDSSCGLTTGLSGILGTGLSMK